MMPSKGYRACPCKLRQIPVAMAAARIAVARAWTGSGQREAIRSSGRRINGTNQPTQDFCSGFCARQETRGEFEKPSGPPARAREVTGMVPLPVTGCPSAGHRTSFPVPPITGTARLLKFIGRPAGRAPGHVVACCHRALRHARSPQPCYATPPAPCTCVCGRRHKARGTRVRGMRRAPRRALSLRSDQAALPCRMPRAPPPHASSAPGRNNRILNHLEPSS